MNEKTDMDNSSLSPPTPNPQQKRLPGHIVVVETCYHQSGNGIFSPSVVESRYTRTLKTDEEPYIKRIQLTEQWKPLDMGWLEDEIEDSGESKIGLLLVENLQGKFTQTQPTLEEREIEAAKIIEIGLGADVINPVVCWKILPGESFRGQPVSPELLLFRCKKGTARCCIALFPA